jgi:all-trans-8'-apo-beta-carotenal 15,15'-oxygenase
MVVEEHILVPKPGATDELDAWLVGTTFDARREVTLLNVLDARAVASGPVAQAALPYWLPLGFHGNFTPA